MSDITNLNEHAAAIEARIQHSCELMVSSNLCHSAKQAEAIVDRFKGLPNFFTVLNTILQQNRKFSRPKLRDALQYKNPVEPLIDYLEATINITDNTEFEDVWEMIDGLWHKDASTAEPGPFVDRVLNITRGVRRHYPQAFMFYDWLYQAEVILNHSSEPAHDLGFFYAGTTANLPDSSLEKLTAYYDEGHHYIAHPNIFGRATLDKNPLNTDEIEIRKAVARLPNYPPLHQQNALFGALLAQPLVAKTMVALMARGVGLQHLKKLLGFDSGENEAPEEGAVPKIIDAMAEYEEPDLIAGITLLGDVLDVDSANIEAYTADFIAGDFAGLQQKVYRLKLQAHAARFPEKPLAEVKTAFFTPETIDSEVPDEALFNRAETHYHAILQRGQELVGISDQDLLDTLASIVPSQISNTPDSPFAHKGDAKADAPSVPDTPEDLEAYRVEFLALVRELFKREFGVYPYNTQMLSILMMVDETFLDENELKGNYQQIKTGEGKSLILALAAAYHGSLNQNVDIVTSNAYLARRDAERFENFFDRMGLTTGSFAHHEESIGNSNPRVLYSTNHDLIFHYLSCRLHNQSFFNAKRHQVALVDEADNLCIDLGEQSCRLAQPSPGLFSSETMQRLLDFADLHGEAIATNLPEAVDEFHKFDPTTRQIHPIYIGLYLRSALSSKHVVKDQDFVIREDQVVVVDVANTGRLQHRTHWEHGMHEFVALRHNLEPPRSMGNSAQMNHPHFIQRYNRVHCISGTLGDSIDRSEIQEVYHLRGFDVPPHHANQRTDMGLRLALSKTEFMDSVTQRAQTLAATGRPVLVVTSSILESEQFYQALKQAGQTVQMLNDANNLDVDGESVGEENIIAQAGNRGIITVATSVAGRGADITPDQAAVEAGGLHSLLTFVPTNTRVEFQARGRAGRQGKPGSSEIIACAETDLTIRRFGPQLQQALSFVAHTYGPSSPQLQVLLELIRKSTNLISSQARIMNLDKESLVQTALQQYFNLIASTTSRLKSANATFQNPSKHNAASFMVANYLSDTWTPGFDYLHTVTEHEHLLTEETPFNPAQQDSPILQKLQTVFNRLVSDDLTQNDELFAPLLDSVYQYFCQELWITEQRVKHFDEDTVVAMMRDLEQKTHAAAAACVAHLENVTPLQLMGINLKPFKLEPPKQDD